MVLQNGLYFITPCNSPDWTGLNICAGKVHIFTEADCFRLPCGEDEGELIEDEETEAYIYNLAFSLNVEKMPDHLSIFYRVDE